MAKRRGHNEGSISYRANQKIWEARVTVGLLSNGKQKRKSIYGKTRKEVATKMTALLNDLKKGNIINFTEIKLGEWLDIYMSEHKKGYVEPTTYINYLNRVNNHIKPALGAYKLTALMPPVIQGFITELRNKNLAPPTVISILKL